MSTHFLLQLLHEILLSFAPIVFVSIISLHIYDWRSRFPFFLTVGGFLLKSMELSSKLVTLETV